jgi:hypothetical protein
MYVRPPVAVARSASASPSNWRERRPTEKTFARAPRACAAADSEVAVLSVSAPSESSTIDPEAAPVSRRSAAASTVASKKRVPSASGGRRASARLIAALSVVTGSRTVASLLNTIAPSG